jgi:hypothetical protein
VVSRLVRDAVLKPCAPPPHLCGRMLINESVTFQHVGQLRGRLEGFCAYHHKLHDFFALLSLKPKRDRVSLREGMVYSWSAKEFDMISFDYLFEGKR